MANRANPQADASFVAPSAQSADPLTAQHPAATTPPSIPTFNPAMAVQILSDLHLEAPKGYGSDDF